MPFWRGLLIVLIAAGLASLAWFATRAPEAPDTLDRRAPVAAFTLPGLNGPPMRLPVPGESVLVNYWASWCVPCRDELPLLARFARQQGPGGIRVVAIALDERAAAAEFLRARGLDLPSLVEDPGPRDSSVRLGNERGVLPYSVLIGPDGRLRKRRFGAFRDADDLQAWAKDP